MANSCSDKELFLSASVIQDERARCSWWQKTEIEEILEEEEESNRQEVVNCIVDEIALLHPIYYDVYDLCQYRKTNKLSQFNVSMLKNILKNYEVPFTAKDRKKDLVQHLAIFVEKCSCFL